MNPDIIGVIFGGGQVDLDRHEILTELDQHPHLVSLTRKARCNHHSNWAEDGPEACLTSLGAALVHLRLDLEKLGCDLTPKSRTMLGLRSSGFEWKEIAEVLHMSATAARTAFWREIKRSTSKNLGRGLWGSSQ